MDCTRGIASNQRRTQTPLAFAAMLIAFISVRASGHCEAVEVFELGSFAQTVQMHSHQRAFFVSTGRSNPVSVCTDGLIKEALEQTPHTHTQPTTTWHVDSRHYHRWGSVAATHLSELHLDNV